MGGVTDTQSVSVSVVDVNEVPSIGNPEDVRSIDENTVSPAPVGALTVLDEDTSDTHTFAITSGNANTRFSIDATGQIKTTETLNFEDEASYSLTVEVTDSGTGALSSSSVVAIAVNDVNENPVITNAASSRTIAENSDAITAISPTVSITDEDTADTHTFAKTGGNSSVKFSISNAGVISTTQSLNFESGQTYALTIEVTDSGTGNLQDTETVTITVTDVNEGGPTITNHGNARSIFENAASGTSILPAIAVTDPGTAETHTFAITAGNTGGRFAIDNSGLITNTEPLNYESVASYTLTVEVTEVGFGLTDRQTVTIDVTNVNEGPSIDNAGVTRSVPENESPPYTISPSVTSSDPDSDTLTYSITNGDPNNRFTIDSNGDIKTAALLNFEEQDTYNLTVKAADPGGLESSSTVIIAVTNVNEAPSITNHADARSVNENSAAVVSVGSALTVDDVDGGDTKTFSITSGNTGNRFSIDASGQIETTEVLDYEQLASYSLTVQVTDGGGLTDSKTIAISVNDVNEGAPVITNTATSRSIAENSAAVSTISPAVLITDVDTSDTHTFNIIAKYDDGQFNIDNSDVFRIPEALNLDSEFFNSMAVCHIQR